MGNQLGRTWKRIRKKVEDEKDTGSAFVHMSMKKEQGRKKGGRDAGRAWTWSCLYNTWPWNRSQRFTIRTDLPWYFQTLWHLTDFRVEWSLVLHYIVVEEWIKRWLKLKVLKMNGCDARAEGRLVLVLWFFRLVGRGEARALGVCVCVRYVQGVMEM